MLVPSKSMVYKAKTGKYAIGCFNTSDLEITKAIIRAAEAQNAPVIISTTPKAIDYAGLATMAGIVKSEAQKVRVPIALHLDHALTLSMVEDCLDNGYTSIMFDGSGSELEHNEILTRQAVEMSHAFGVPCEGELGHLGSAKKTKSQFTNPDDVIGFVQKTGVDFLAVSIGSSHGISDDEKLDIDLLKKISSKTSIPLVLHGASGVSESDIKKAIQDGIAKVNIDTDIRHTFTDSIKKVFKIKSSEKDPRVIMTDVMNDLQKLIEDKIKLFGADNKAT